MPGLALTLGVPEPPSPPLLEAVERGEDGRWRMRRGIGPVRAVRDYATPAPDGIRLLQCGKVGVDGLPAIRPAVQAFHRVVHRLDGARTFDDWSVIGDLPAGPRQLAYDWAPYARAVVVVAEPTAQSLLTARRVARLAEARRGTPVVVVANRVRDAAGARRVAAALGRPVAVTIPLDEAVRTAESRGRAPVDAAPDAPAVRAVGALAGMLAEPGRVAA